MPAPFPKVLGNGLLGKTAMAINQLLIRVSKSLFSYQIFVVAETTPDVDFILQDSQAAWRGSPTGPRRSRYCGSVRRRRETSGPTDTPRGGVTVVRAQ